MADNLKPYDPNKGFISFRLNPDAIKEELISFVPYNRTLRHIYNNPEGDIRETAKVAASETPILGSLLSGEYSDAAKEAFLMGLPIKAPSSLKKEINKLPKTTEFRQEGSNTIRAYDPKSGDSWRVLLDMTGNGRIIPDYSYNTANFRANRNPTYNAAQVNGFIDQSNNLHKLNKDHRLETRPEIIGNPYDLDRLSKDPQFANSIEGKLLQEGDDLAYLYNNGDGGPNTLRNRVNNYETAQSITPNLKKTEQLYVDDYNNLYIKSRGKYYLFSADLNTGRILDKQLDKPHNPRPYSDPTLNSDLRDWNTKVKLYNAKYGAEDNFINFKDANKWYDDVYNAREEYLNSMHGPYFEDIMGLDR